MEETNDHCHWGDLYLAVLRNNTRYLSLLPLVATIMDFFFAPFGTEKIQKMAGFYERKSFLGKLP